MPSPLFLLPYRAHAPPSTSNSTGPAALTYTLCGRAPGARQRAMVTATALYAYYLLSLQLMATRFTYVGNKVLQQVLLPPYLPTTTKTYTPLQEFSFFPSSLPFTFVPSHITCSTPSTSFHLVVHLLPQHERIPILNPEVVERSSIHH